MTSFKRLSTKVKQYTTIIYANLKPMRTVVKIHLLRKIIQNRYTEANRQTGGERQADRQTNRETNRQTD